MAIYHCLRRNCKLRNWCEDLYDAETPPCVDIFESAPSASTNTGSLPLLDEVATMIHNGVENGRSDYHLAEDILLLIKQLRAGA